MDNNIWDNIGRAVTGAADTVSRKATEVAGVAKLKNQIFSLERDMKRDYEAIGKIVYERFAAAGSIDDVPLQQLCEEIERSNCIIAIQSSCAKSGLTIHVVSAKARYKRHPGVILGGRFVLSYIGGPFYTAVF